MKIKALIFSLLFVMSHLSANAIGSIVIHQHIDPTTTAAIIAQTAALSGLYGTRIGLQSTITGAEALLNATMGGIHDIQKKTFEYLSHAQSAISSLSQIATITKLTFTEIPGNVKGLLSDISNHPQKAFLAEVNGQLLGDIVLEATEIAGLIEGLVTSSTVKKDKDGNIDTKGKVNLLNGAERYAIAETILSKLRGLNSTIVSARWHIKSVKVPRLNLDVKIELKPKEAYNGWDKVAVAYFGAKK